MTPGPDSAAEPHGALEPGAETDARPAPHTPHRPSRPTASATRARAAALAGLATALLVALAVAPPELRDFRGPLDAPLATPPWPLATLALMALALLSRAEAWNAILRASLAGASPVSRRDTARATMIGVLMSASLPARLGEVARALIVACRLGPMRERLPLVAGTIVSQSVLNVVALALLGTAVAAAGLIGASGTELALATLAPAAAVLAAVGGTAIVRTGGARPARPLLAAVSRSLARLRLGLAVFGRPRLAGHAAAAQLGAWALQLLACYVMLLAFGLEGQAGFGGAAAVLFAVNAAALLPGLPSNIGVFQAACVAALAAFGVGHGEALGYGIALQALELTVAAGLGAPALVAEGTGWRAMRARAVDAAPIAVPAPRTAET